MTWLQRIRPALYLLGVLLVVGSLLGARLLTHGSGGGTEPTQKTALPPGNGKANGNGPIVTGYADSDPTPIPYSLPPVLQSGRIAKLSVKQGDEVKKGDTLYVFDTTVQKAQLENAQTAVESAKVAVELAQSQLDQFPKQLEIKRQMWETAKLKAERDEAGYKTWDEALRDTLNTNYKDKPDQWKQQYDINPKRFELETAKMTSALDRETARVNYEAAQAAQKDLELNVKKAKAAVRQADALVHQAQSVLDQCTMKADADGTIERVTVAEGSTLGLSNHAAAVILVPSGPRVVRAEVEAEFAHLIGPDKENKEVTITDHFDRKLTYKGVVRHIGKAFLQKRTAADGFGVNDTRVLEVLVEVPDPAPAGKPSLKVGQKVRVNFGQ
jgi:multidrug resistance efflux pump